MVAQLTFSQFREKRAKMQQKLENGLKIREMLRRALLELVPNGVSIPMREQRTTVMRQEKEMRNQVGMLTGVSPDRRR